MFDRYIHENDLSDELDIIDIVTGDIDEEDDGEDIDMEYYDEESDDEYLYLDASDLDDERLDYMDLESDDIITDIVNDVDGDLIDIVNSATI